MPPTTSSTIDCRSSPIGMVVRSHSRWSTRRVGSRSRQPVMARFSPITPSTGPPWPPTTTLRPRGWSAGVAIRSAKYSSCAELLDRSRCCGCCRPNTQTACGISLARRSASMARRGPRSICRRPMVSSRYPDPPRTFGYESMPWPTVTRDHRAVGPRCFRPAMVSPSSSPRPPMPSTSSGRPRPCPTTSHVGAPMTPTPNEPTPNDPFNGFSMWNTQTGSSCRRLHVRTRPRKSNPPTIVATTC